MCTTEVFIKYTVQMMMQLEVYYSAIYIVCTCPTMFSGTNLLGGGYRITEASFVVFHFFLDLEYSSLKYTIPFWAEMKHGVEL